MRTTGVEPGPLTGQDPKSCASASSATFALRNQLSRPRTIQLVAVPIVGRVFRFDPPPILENGEGAELGHGRLPIGPHAVRYGSLIHLEPDRFARVLPLPGSTFASDVGIDLLAGRADDEAEHRLFSRSRGHGRDRLLGGITLLGGIALDRGRGLDPG